ncbi:MAG TPA: GNAT family N-acetyltransferase [Cyanobacteria bacterium UBA11369]|nr:GNAT family N-acetyltransferase [Cyanobacteria bacterium UBA11371]HBE32309.1 GNAT family N-acetyltransferase [Cyanobacteria bacterium UBA11368]HBE52934.1 GNAT family N-acetyltransferase [Cyanobacteria bacterium UBA11369]
MSIMLPPGYQLRSGSSLDRAMLVKFMQKTYQEFYPERDFSHLAQTVEQYLSKDTPLWWVEFLEEEDQEAASLTRSPAQAIASLWLGNAVDQVKGSRHTHIFLLYVAPEHRRKGIGTALMHHAEDWARARSDRQISLQVFLSNQPAVNLYHQLGYQTESLLMVKSIN